MQLFELPVAVFWFKATPILLRAHFRTHFHQKNFCRPCQTLHTLQYASLGKQEHNGLTDYFLNYVNSDV